MGKPSTWLILPRQRRTAMTFGLRKAAARWFDRVLSALWVWIAAKLPGTKQPVVELVTDTALDTTVHNKRLLICSQPVALQALDANMGNGFSCDVLNLSNGAVMLSGNIVTSSGEPLLPPGQTATIRCIEYSGGTVVYAGLSHPGGGASPPAAVTSLTVIGTGPSSVVSRLDPGGRRIELRRRVSCCWFDGLGACRFRLGYDRLYGRWVAFEHEL